MVKISINKTKRSDIKNLYYHLSVQSLLDIKAVNGFVGEDVLLSLLNSASNAWTVSYDDKIAYIVYVLPTDENECSIFVAASTLGYSDTDALNVSFSDIIKGLPDCYFYSIVYKGNHKYVKLLKDNGFEYKKTIIHGEEKRKFILLGKDNGKRIE